jgi:DNA-directed RNA polymerase specialized sigma24 family protein
MATMALDIHGQGVAVQSYQDKVQQLTEAIVRHLARFRQIARRLLGNIAAAEDAVQDAFLSSHTWISSEDKRRCPRGSRPS